MHRVGTVLAGRYRVDELLVQGAAGSVYRGYRQDMERVVALKVLNSQDANLLARFKREIKTTAKLQHPNVISIFEAGKTDDGRIFYAMEYLAGERLRDVINRETRLTARRTHHILQQLAAALGEAHTLGIIHRNLNPDDIMVGQQAGNPDFCTILDFGVARLENADSELTLQGEVLGQPEYFAPEMLGEEDTGPAADIYAIGCMAYECLTGHPPFQSKPRMRAVWMHVRDPVPPFPADVVASTPEPLRDLVMWCLEKDPGARPRDGRALSQRLENLDMSSAVVEENEPRQPERQVSAFQTPGPAVRSTVTTKPQNRSAAPTAQAAPQAQTPPPQQSVPQAHGRQETPAPSAHDDNSAARRRLKTPFSNNVVARRPNSRRPLGRGELLAGAKKCTFVVHHAGSEALGGSALFGASGMDLTIGAQLLVSLPVDRQGGEVVQLSGQIQSVDGHPPTLIIEIKDFGQHKATYLALVAKWQSLHR